MATLTINFTSNNNPTNGYIVKYRQVGTSQYTTVSPNPTGSPVLITGLGAGMSYEGTIQADCGNGQYGVTGTFNAAVAAKFTMARDPSSAANACALTNFNYTFYAAVSVLQIGTQLYVDDALSIGYSTGGYYSDGVWVYQVSSVGVVLSKTACASNITVVNAYAYPAVCEGGSVNNVVGGSITVSAAVSVPTPFEIAVTYYTSSGSCNSVTESVIIYGTIQAGQTSGYIDPCAGGALASGIMGVCNAVGTINNP